MSIKIKELNIKANITGGHNTETKTDIQPKAEERISVRSLLHEFYDSQPTQNNER
jgi:hypothetical protein